MPQHPEDCLQTLLAGFAGRLFVGFSGGVDSTALLVAASRIREVNALHVDHGIHPESANWAEHCAEVCHALDVSLTVTRLQLPQTGNLEANARAERYEFYRQHVGENDLLLLGHHQTDQLESVLLRMLQGRGMVAMQRRGQVAGVPVARPFVDLHKSELVAYVEAAGQHWIEDPSNLDNQFDRNFLRNELLPSLLARWPDAAQAFQRVADSQRHRDQALDYLLSEYPDHLPLALLPDDEGVAVVILRTWLIGQGLFTTTDQSLREFFAQCRRGDKARINIQDRDLKLVGQNILLE